MAPANSNAQSRTADQYVVRFEQAGHRDRLKAQALQDKRSLNRHILMLIETGEKAMNQLQGAQA